MTAKARLSKSTASSRSEVPDLLAARLKDVAHSLPSGMRRVARFISDNRAVTLGASAANLASRTGTSDATVVRTVQAMGFAGMADLKRALADTLAADPTNPAEAMRRTLAETGINDARQAIDHAIEVQRIAVDALEKPEVRDTLQAAVVTLHPAKRIMVFGLGPSAALAQYTAILLGRSGRISRALDTSGVLLADLLLDLNANDALIVLAYGRAYREVIAVFAEAKRLSLPLVLITDSLEPSLAKSADVVVRVRRGQAGRVALHGATLVALEAVILGLASLDSMQALSSLDRLNDLRAAIAGERHDTGVAASPLHQNTAGQPQKPKALHD
jgi:DNA-binding MurR/RpiR family transcriptional regulator